MKVEVFYLNELKVLKQCQNGSKQAFNELIIFYYPFVFKFLLKTTNKDEIAKDLVQETFLKLIKNIDKFDVKGKAKFSTYLITIARNCYLDYLKKETKELQNIAIEEFSDNASSEYNYLKNEDYNNLLNEINKLPKLQREVIKLKYLEGYTLSEIAKIQNTTSNTIKSRLFESRKKLKDKLKGSRLYE